MTVRQFHLRLPPFPRGFHLIDELVKETLQQTLAGEIRTGTAHLFLQHTSASLSINENADPSVRNDAQTFIDALIPEDYPYFTHTYEGSDDMPAHLKSMLLGNSLSIPLVEGRLGLGTWQGIYLGEHRDHASSRSIIITVQGV